MHIHNDVIKKFLPFLFPEISRGPANDEWVAAMKELGEETLCEPCKHCEGVPAGCVCGSCLGTGFDWGPLGR